MVGHDRPRKRHGSSSPTVVTDAAFQCCQPYRVATPLSSAEHTQDRTNLDGVGGYAAISVELKCIDVKTGQPRTFNRHGHHLLLRGATWSTEAGTPTIMVCGGAIAYADELLVIFHDNFIV